MLKEFKEFALKGNMLDIAVGIVIGAAFGTVVTSLVSDVLMPVIAGLIRMPDFSNLYVVLSNPTGADVSTLSAAREGGAAVLAIGLFINACIAFLIVCGALFFVVRGVNRLKRTPAPVEVVTAPPAPSGEERLLAEIRDLIRAQQV